jgi:AraC family transcriptional regulator
MTGTVRPFSAPVRSGLAPWQTRRVLNHIEEHLDGSIPISDLAAVCRLSVSYFSGAFRRSFGVPPGRFIARLRIARAQRLILSTSQPLAQVALACGFCDQAHLSNRFRRVVGSTPQSWRRQHLFRAFDVEHVIRQPEGRGLGQS